MSDIYVYMDETGSCDYTPDSGPRFVVGSATYVGDHKDGMWSGFAARTRVERAGVDLRHGFHATQDSNKTRGEFFKLIEQHPPRFDATFFTKERAFATVRSRGKPYLYKLALYQHLKHLIPLISSPGDDIYVIAGTIDLSSMKSAARNALADVCQQLARDRTITPCLWEARTSWGIQVADYCLWALQRHLDRRECKWYDDVVEAIQASCYGPWD